MQLLDHYQEEGYVIVPDLIPHARIDHLVDRLEHFKRMRRPFWSESIHQWILPELDERGLMTQSMENFTRLWLSGGLNAAGNDVLLGHEINDVMKTLEPQYGTFVHWLNHFFDRSTGSIDHIDHWYLDTDPPGKLIGAWIALEDIHPDAGPFRFFPRSHRMPEVQGLWELDHVAFVKHCTALCDRLEAQGLGKLAIIRKGTVVFFHPFLLHGAVEQKDPRYSRKSVTGHYLPYGCLRRERQVQRDPAEQRLAREMKQARRIGEHPVMVSHSFRDEWNFNWRGLRQYAISLATGPKPITMDMRRRSWAKS